MIVALFEDESYENFLPLTFTRAVFELRSGMFSSLQRAERMFPKSKLLLFARECLLPTLRHRVPHLTNDVDAVDDDVLTVNAALRLNKQTLQLIRKKMGKNVALTQKDTLVLARLSETVAKKYGSVFLKPTPKKFRKLLRECNVLKAERLPLMNYLWDLVDSNSEVIKDDFTSLSEKESEGIIDEKAVVYGEKSSVYMGKKAFVESFVTLDTRNGPIFIGENTVVQSGSRISGPAYVGNNTVIASALIREGCSIGDVCRIGGELEQTTVQGFSNKYHLGYIGHSYIGEWLNIGAATTNSNLKNTYGSVKVTVKEKRVDTGRTKVGCFIGDHAKTSIGTQIYTGVKIGVASHVHGVVTQDVPSFTIWAESLGVKPAELHLKSAIETQRRVMARRRVRQTREDIELMRKLFALTTRERQRAKVTKQKFKL